MSLGATKGYLGPDRGGGLWRARNRKWTHPVNRPLAFEPSPKEAQTRQERSCSCESLVEPPVRKAPRHCFLPMLSFRVVEEQHIRRILASTKSLQEAAGILGIDLA